MTVSSSTNGSDWEDQPDDPDLSRDLGYDLLEMRSVKARSGGRDHLLFLPEEDEMLRSEAFIVAHPDVVCQLEEYI